MPRISKRKGIAQTSNNTSKQSKVEECSQDDIGVQSVNNMELIHTMWLNRAKSLETSIAKLDMNDENRKQEERELEHLYRDMKRWGSVLADEIKSIWKRFKRERRGYGHAMKRAYRDHIHALSRPSHLQHAFLGPFSYPIKEKLPLDIYYYDKFIKNEESIIPQIAAWASSQSSNRLDEHSISTLASYCRDSFRFYWTAFEEYKWDASDAIHRPSVTSFLKCFDHFDPIPVGTQLFEGYGIYEKDLLQQFDSLTEGETLTRFRPTSTSWHPSVALCFIMSYLSNCMTEQDFYDTTVPPSFPSRSAPPENELLVVYTIKDPNIKGIYINGMEVGTPTECEVLLQPFLKFVITKIEKNAVSLWRPLNRPGNGPGLIKHNILYIDVYSADKPQ